MDLQKIQAYMQQEGIGAWLVYDFRGGNPVLWQLLGQRRQTTRRVFLIVPAVGAPRLLGSAVEPEALAGLGIDIAHYASWEQLHALLRDAVEDLPQVAMEYWPGGTLPTVSWVDGGTLELVRSLGPEVVSSADLCQVALATWSADALASHRDACRQVAEVKDAAFEYIRAASTPASPNSTSNRSSSPNWSSAASTSDIRRSSPSIATAAIRTTSRARTQPPPLNQALGFSSTCGRATPASSTCSAT